MTNDDKPKNLEKKSFSVNTSRTQISKPDMQTFNLSDLPPPPLYMKRQYTCYGDFEMKDKIEARNGYNNIFTFSVQLLDVCINPSLEDYPHIVSHDHDRETWDIEDLLLGFSKELPTP